MSAQMDKPLTIRCLDENLANEPAICTAPTSGTFWKRSELFVSAGISGYKFEDKVTNIAGQSGPIFTLGH